MTPCFALRLCLLFLPVFLGWRNPNFSTGLRRCFRHSTWVWSVVLSTCVPLECGVKSSVDFCITPHSTLKSNVECRVQSSVECRLKSRVEGRVSSVVLSTCVPLECGALSLRADTRHSTLDLSVECGVMRKCVYVYVCVSVCRCEEMCLHVLMGGVYVLCKSIRVFVCMYGCIQ